MSNTSIRPRYGLGMFSGDIILRTCIQAGIDDLRINPYLLDFIWSNLLYDDLTKAYYGEKEIEKQKEWFLQNEIVVTNGNHPDQAKTPHVTIWLDSQTEHAKITGDVNDVPQEELNLTQYISKSPSVLVFTPKSYDSATGIVTLLPSQSTEFIYPGMRVWDRVGNRFYEILEILSGSTFSIESGSLPNLTKAEIVNATDLAIVTLEGITNEENYRVQISTVNDPLKCLILHQIILFILYRYRQDYLEARGFDRTRFSSSGVGGPIGGQEQSQWIFQRTISVSALCRQYWPKRIGYPIQGIALGDGSGGPGINVLGAGDPVGAELEAQTVAQGWGTTSEE